MTKTSLLAILIYIFTVNIGAQDLEDIPDLKIEISPGKYTASEILSYLNNYEGVNLVYNTAPSEMETFILLEERSYDLTVILNIICKELLYECIVKEDYLILKKRKLKDSYHIHGKVNDKYSGKGLMAANIYLYNSRKGIIANDSGYFELELPPGHYKLIASYVGFDPKVRDVYLTQDKEVEFFLDPGENRIDEVLVYGEQNKLEDFEIGRTVQTLDKKQLRKVKLNNPTDALQGRLKGVWTTKSSGAPGDQQKIRIRGINSILNSVEPLYIVDGIPVPVVNSSSMGISDLNMHDIAQIKVLKDASSTSLYGYLGGNGVIMIDTKQGGGDDMINFYTMQGVQTFQNNYYNMSDTKRYLQTYYMADSLLNYGFYQNDDNPYAKYPVYSDSMETTNWQKELFSVGKVEEYHLSAEGNTKWFNHYISGGYYKHDGIIKNSMYEKYTLNTSISKSYKKIRVGLNYRGGVQNNRNNINGFEGNYNILKYINTEPGYHSTPDSFLFKSNRLLYNYKGLKTERPDKINQLFEESLMKNRAVSNFARVYFNCWILEGLTLHSNIGYSLRKTRYESMYYGQLISNTDHFKVINQNYKLSYQKYFNDHEFHLSLQYRDYRDNIYWNVDSTSKIDYSRFEPYPNLYQKGSLAIYGKKGSIVRRTRSVIPALNYNYKKKYFVSALINRDHLEEGEYQTANSWFPSISVNWDLSKEIGLKEIKRLDHFNVYANWGIVGNDPLSSTSNDIFQEVTPGYDYDRPGQFVSNLANQDLVHEKIEEVNIGSEIDMFNSRLRFNVDLFEKKISNLMLQTGVPYYYGGGTMFLNVGRMKNQGFELTLEATPVRSDHFDWYVRMGYSDSKQIVIELNESDTMFFNNEDVLIPQFRVQVGEKIGNIYGYKYLGLWTHEDEVSEDKRYVERYEGKYLNTDTSNLAFNEDDKVVIGNAIPEFTFSFFTSFRYKNFELSMLWYGVQGVDKFNSTKASTFMSGRHFDSYGFILDTARVLKYSAYYQSSAFIEDASFIRLKNLTFSYQLAKPVFNAVDVSFSLTLENLLTITNYSGYDPEATIYTRNNFSDNAIDKGAYPNPRGYYLSLNLTF